MRMMAVKNTLTAAMLASFVSACAVIGPDYESPDPMPVVSSPQTFVNEGRTTVSAPPLARWWEAFDDPVLNDLAARLVDHNRDLRGALERLNTARAAYGLARLDRLPTDTASASWTRSHSAAVNNNQLGSRTRNQTELSIGAAWEVDLFGRVTRQIRIARAGLDEAGALLADLHIVLLADLADAYLSYRGAEVELAVARHFARNQLDTLTLTRTRREVGRGTDLDVERAAAQLSETRAAIPPLEAQMRTQAYRIGVLVGVAPADSAALFDRKVRLPLISKPLAIGDPAALLRRRPDIAAAERALAASTERVGVTLAEAFPQISLTGSVGSLSADVSDIAGTGALQFALGPTLNWSLTNLIRLKDRMAGARAQSREALAAYEQTVLLALAETETALSRQAAFRRQLIHLDAARKATANAARLARLRYENGAEDFLTVLDAERRALEAARALTVARAETARAEVEVFRALRAGAPAALAH